jgi:hypothetical protein
MIEWMKRCKRADTPLSERRIWRSRCGLYQVLESNIRYGRSYDKRGNFLGYPIYYLAMVKRDGHWHVLSEHRKRGPATKALEYYADNGRLPPKKTKANKAKKRLKAKRQAKRKAKEE